MPATKLINHLFKLSPDIPVSSLSAEDEALIEKNLIDTQTDNRAVTALHVAIEKNQPIWVRKLLDHGAKLNIKNKAGFTALQLAKASNNPVMIEAVNSAEDSFLRKSVMIRLVSDKAILAQERMTKLKMYLEQGYDINYATATKKTTLLHLCVSYQVLNMEMFELFQKYGVDLKAKDSQGRTPSEIPANQIKGKLLSMLKGEPTNDSSSQHQLPNKQTPADAMEKPTLQSLNKQIEDEQTRLTQAQQELATQKQALQDHLLAITTSLTPKETQFKQVTDQIVTLLASIKTKDEEIVKLQDRKASVIKSRNQLLLTIQSFAKALEARNRLGHELGQKPVETHAPQPEPANDLTRNIDRELAQNLSDKSILMSELAHAKTGLEDIRKEMLTIKSKSAEKANKEQLIQQSEAKILVIQESIIGLEKKRDALNMQMCEELKVQETQLATMQNEIEKMMAEMREMAGVPAAQQQPPQHDDNDVVGINGTQTPLMLSGHKRAASPTVVRKQVQDILGQLNTALGDDTTNNNKKPRLDLPSPR